MAFNNAHHFGINHFHNHIVQNLRPLPSQPADILRFARSAEASHRSGAATYAIKCHPKTREQVITDIVDWVGGAGASRPSTPRELILWFSGPAGSGKTCAMRNVVDCCEAAGFSLASYFFSTRDAGLTIERPFVATVVHQLTISQPDLKKEVLDIIRRYPTIFEESLDFQMDELLVRPLQSTALLPHPPKIVIAIDGLDECSEEHEREHLLNLLHTLVTKLPRLITVVIASRPEFDLRRVFASSKLSNITKVVQLQKYNGTEDVWVFLCDEFEEIRRSHPLKVLIPEGWPFEGIVQLLVDKSSGNFILPSTAAKYICKSRRNPVGSLNIIVGLLENPSPDTSNPFAELDALYSHILHPPDTDLALMKWILHCLLSIGPGDSAPAFLDGFLALPPGTTTITLCDLHAILSVPDSEGDDIEFHHKSLQDYLRDPKRSRDFFQSEYDTNLGLAIVCAERLAHWDANPAVGPSYALFYTCWSWDTLLGRCLAQKPSSAILPDIILNMDPRICMKYVFVVSQDHMEIFCQPPRRLHDDLCSERHCVRLCQLFSHVNICLDRCVSFSETFGRDDYEGRVEALPRFVLETGLYAPVHPESRTVFDGICSCGRLENDPIGVGR